MKKNLYFKTGMALLMVLSSSALVADEAQQSSASSNPFTEGQWETTTIIQLTNLAVPARPIPISKCMTQELVSQGHVPLHIAKACTLKAGSLKGQDLQLIVDCGSNSNAIMTGQLHFEQKSFSGKAEIVERTEQGPGEGYRFVYQGKRVGDCPR